MRTLITPDYPLARWLKGDEADRFKYKVPSLLNVAMTPPYTHAGVVKDLPTMVWTMGQKMPSPSFRTPRWRTSPPFCTP